MRTPPLALLRYYSMVTAPETQLSEQPRWSITLAIPVVMDHSTALLAPLRSILTTADLVTMPLAIPRCLEMLPAQPTPLLAIWRWRTVTQTALAKRTSTALLALRRFSPILTAIQTTPLVLPRCKPT